MMMMRHLIWKDMLTIRPLFYAVAAGIVGLNLLLAILLSMLGASANDMKNTFVSLWILMPNLVALGAPALLVGSEEESGTLAWLRTLPVSWQKIVDAKFLTALGAVAVTWVAASLVLALILAMNRSATPSYARELLSTAGILHLMFFSVLLLATGFATAYLFRSPISALIALLPAIGIAHGIALEVGHWLLSGLLLSPAIPRDATSGQLIMLIAIGLTGLVVAWIVQRLLGRRRLTAMQGSPMANLMRSASVSTAEAYRPPSRIGSSRPSPVVALLWHQTRQMRWSGALLTLVMALFLALHFTRNSFDMISFRAIAAFAPLVIGLGASWLGCLAYYGDNVRHRRAFFSDRGISPTQVWWTRLLPPAIAVAVLVVLSIVLSMITDRTYQVDEFSHPGLMPGLLIAGFAFGQLVGQWVQRPALAFFGAPAYALFSCILVIITLTLYPTYAWTIVLILPALLFATWRLTSRWLTGRFDFGFHWRVIAYTALSSLLPILAVAGHRYWTTPELMPQWRAEMLAMTDSHEPSFGWDQVDWLSLPGIGTRVFDEEFSVDEHIALLRRELAEPESIGTHVGYDDLDQYLNFGDRGRLQYANSAAVFREADREEIAQMQRLSIEILLKWATRIRENYMHGNPTAWTMRVAVDLMEWRAVRGLNLLTQRYGATDELARLVAKIPSQELRTRSRRIALINEWQRYSRTPWIRQDKYRGIERKGKWFGGEAIASTVNWNFLERIRADRSIDLATRRTLEQLDRGLPANDSEQYRELQRLWGEAIEPKNRGGHRIQTGLLWDNQTDKDIAELRSRYAGVSLPQ